jgi:hypothetical protein
VQPAEAATLALNPFALNPFALNPFDLNPRPSAIASVQSTPVPGSRITMMNVTSSSRLTNQFFFSVDSPIMT